MQIIAKKLGPALNDPVTLLVFTDGGATGRNLIALANTLSSMNSKIKVEVEEVGNDKNQRTRDLRIHGTPALVLMKDGFARIKYFGVPTEYELPAIVDAIVELSAGQARLAPMATESLSKVRHKANIKVFVLVTCPFCPMVARHAYRAAIASPLVTTEVIDSSVFQELSMRHSVMGVPKIVLNDNTDITGAVDEVAFFEKLRDSDLALLDSMFG
jgi:glutaredoxin-like protein